MTASGIISFIIFLFVAAIMAGIGISQLRSASPVGFYTGEKPPREEELTDVQAWNKKHGMMWLFYGIVILVSYFASYLINDDIWCVVLMCAGVILPILVMVWYHHKLVKEFTIKK